jgi:hypothetical protein
MAASMPLEGFDLGPNFFGSCRVLDLTADTGFFSYLSTFSGLTFSHKNLILTLH